jgi:hypothetical protein
MDHLQKHGFWLVVVVGAALVFANHRATPPQRPSEKFDKAADKFVSDMMRTMTGPMSRKQSVVWQVCWVETEVNNGGFHQYFFNSTGDVALESVVLLRKIGAPETANLVEAGCKLFPDGKPAKDLYERRAQLERFTLQDEAALHELDERFYWRKEDLNLLLKQWWDKEPEEEAATPLET